MSSVENDDYIRMVKNALPRLSEAEMIVFAESVQVRSEKFYGKIRAVGHSIVNFLVPGGVAAMNGVSNLSVNLEQGIIEKDF